MALRKLRVAIVSTQAGWYGGEQQACLLAGGLIEAGHECRVFAPAGSPFAAGMAARGFDTTEFPGAAHSVATLRQLRRQLRSDRIDIVHANDPRAFTATALALLGRRAPARVVSRRVDFVPRSPWAYRIFACRVICVSEASRRRCEAAGIAADALRVVHDGVDADRIDSGARTRGRQTLQLDEAAVAVLTVASLQECKGHRHLLRAFARVRRQIPAAQLFLAGEGSELASLQALAAQLGIAEQVHWLGYRSDVPDLIHACDLLVLPSTEEGLGSSLIDGMLASRPIVASATGGIPELLGPNKEGHPMARLVPPANPEALAAAMLAALGDGADDGGRCRRAEARARHELLASKMVARTIAVYEQLLR